MIVVIDNYDSFVGNVARYFRELGAEVGVFRNDALTVADVAAIRPRAVVISPGPGTPDDAGISAPLVADLTGRLPILGICLGHQAIGAVFGGRVVRAAEPMHGRASTISHDGRDLFAGLSNPLSVGRYHSLIVEIGDDGPLAVTARSSRGEVMALAHREHPTFGVQFHPESVLTESGPTLFANFLRLADAWSRDHRRQPG
jgi:anthranilate synthase/aminodeoxychorismate synthase-like glutamine amidotransferase